MVRWAEHTGLGGVQLLDDRIGAAALGREVNLDGREACRGLGYILGLAAGEEAGEAQTESKKKPLHGTSFSPSCGLPDRASRRALILPLADRPHNRPGKLLFGKARPSRAMPWGLVSLRSQEWMSVLESQETSQITG